jgi:hypothetical protein
MCSATPQPHTERLFSLLARFLEYRVNDIYSVSVTNKLITFLITSFYRQLSHKLIFFQLI